MDERVVVAADAEGTLARAQDLHLARTRGLDPDHGIGLTHVAQQGTEEELRHCRNLPRRSAARATGYFPRVESELQRVGRSIHAAFPARGRNPFRALDERAMELAAQDQELRAALFRFVDVTPACRSLDDLARHLTGFLGEIEQPTAPIGVAMKMGSSKAGRAALGAAAAPSAALPALLPDIRIAAATGGGCSPTSPR